MSQDPSPHRSAETPAPRFRAPEYRTPESPAYRVPASRVPRRTEGRRPVLPASEGFFRNMPASLRYGLPLAVIAVLVFQFWPQLEDMFVGSTARVLVLDSTGEPLTKVRFEVFEMDDSFFGPSPARELGGFNLESQAGTFVLGEEQIPAEALIRITAPGHGVSYRHIRRGRKKAIAISLGKPMQVAGTVFSVADKPLPNARVLALGGGSRGVLLTETATDAGGRFEFKDLSDSLHFITVRVLRKGYSLDERDWWRDAIESAQNLDFRLRPVPPTLGKVLLPKGLEAKGLRAEGLEIRIYQLPGVTAPVGKDGSFVLDHLAKPDVNVFRVLVGNLPPGYTHPMVRVRPGDAGVLVPVQEAVTVTGRVVDSDGWPVKRGRVSHECGPRGGRDAELVDGGQFTLEGLPKGEREIRITLKKSKRHPNGGVRIKSVRVSGGEDAKPLVLTVR